MMGLSLLILIAVVGLGVVAVVVAIVVVLALSRREDFVNPFSGPKASPPPPKNISPEVPQTIAPNLYTAPALDGEAALVDWLIGQASAQTRIKLEHDPMVRERMLNAVRNAMRDLETQDTTQISLPFLAADTTGPKHFEIKITRSMLDQMP
ncbi:MAG: Hsp70 family protein [Anaerolineales bacterium]|nr:Hsp70 family protein [Anaerolineales bacterium]